jgi:hypothetical protein
MNAAEEAMKMHKKAMVKNIGFLAILGIANTPMKHFKRQNIEPPII